MEPRELGTCQLHPTANYVTVEGVTYCEECVMSDPVGLFFGDRTPEPIDEAHEWKMGRGTPPAP